ncbi:MAG: hypothetical protein M1821_004191 [Bathelium mastoideum]|nr:MAG: hypothetical protein M1821_004191 [Bathelium mastoideum]
MASSHSPRAKRATSAKSYSKNGTRAPLAGLSPPATPKANAMTLAKLQPPSYPYTSSPSEGTFLEDVTPVENQQGAERKEKGMRDSHDLSLAETQRQSLVDNMLMSLDQFGPAAYSNCAALYNNLDDENTMPAVVARSPFRHRGHTLSSSYSSNYGMRESLDDSSSRYSSHPSKGRRSNSSSNFPTTSLRNGAPPLSMHGRGNAGRKGSKGSGSSSLDYGYSKVIGTTKWGMPSSHRSASVDNIYDAAHGNSPMRQNSAMMERGRPVPLDLWDGEDEAAPEPLVRSGPVRQPRNGSPLTLPPQSSYGPNSGKDMSKSSLREIHHSPARDTHIPESIRRQASDFVSANSLPPEALIPDPIAPAPAIGYQKSAEEPHSSGINVGGNKERPGFFRRVFGSSRSNTNSPNPRHSVVSDDTGCVDRGENSRLKAHANPTHIASQLRADVTSPSRDAFAEAEPPKPALQKKPSSFFRRRKRSVTDAGPPPSLPAQFSAHMYPPMPPSQPSPSISSLRKVMTPWLNGAHASPTEAVFDARQTVRVENDDTVYMDDGYAGQAKHHAPRASAGNAASRRDGTSQNAAMLQANDFAVAEQKIKTSLMRYDHGDTFLADNSDVEEKPRLGDDSMKIRAGTKEAGEAKPTHIDLPPPTSAQKQQQLPETHSSSLVHAEAIKKKSFPSQATSPQSVETAKTHWDSNEKISPADDETYVVTTVAKGNHAPPSNSSNSQRLWLNPTKSEEKLDQSSSVCLQLPIEGSRPSASILSPSSEADDELSTSVPDSRLNADISTQDASLSVGVAGTAVPFADVNEPTEEDKQRAEQIFNGDETFVSKSEAAAWLGDKEAVNLRTRKAYMELFNWTDMNVLAAMRDFCQRLVLKGETQQIDRLLHAFSRRWCACNVNHGFKDFDVIHTISYSILLLNTDLHLADIESKMTRNQFVRNTLPTIKNVVSEAAPDAFDATVRPSPAQSRGTIPWIESPAPTSPNSPSFPPENTDGRTSFDLKERPVNEAKGTLKRLSLRPPIRTDSGGILTWNPDSAGATEAIDALVRNRFEGSLKGWEMQIEAILKEFYKSIEKQRLPLHGVDPALSREADENLPPAHRANSIASTWTNSMLRRTPSMLSKAPSESASFRGRLDSAPATTHSRSLAARWTSKASRPLRPRLYPPPALSTNGHGGNSSSRTSLDDGSGMWSPSGASSTWSRYSLNKTATTMSVDSFASSRFGLSSSSGWGGAYQKSIGFANALSQAIIREEGTGAGSALASPNSGSTTFVSANAGIMPMDSEDMLGGGRVPLLDDERLQLIGAPWAKEGMVKHKHHLESKDKKSRTRNWTECFAVVENGCMRLFAFNTKTTSARQKALQGRQGPAIVGGGNWTSNAEALDAFPLRQTIASALPEPGYSKSRPYVWALSLPEGAVHLFQAGTADIVREFVSTVNYWAARLSKEPLIGGVSNVEYGWSETVIGPVADAHLPARSRESRSMSVASTNRPPSASTHLGRTSTTVTSGRPSVSSIRTSLDQGASHIGMGTTRGARLPGDKVTITEWQPPVTSMMASQLLEVDQLRALTAYVQSLEADLGKHQELRAPMQSAYSPRHPNNARANANWERKSAYLLKEIVKFNTYIESLQRAHEKKEAVLPAQSVEPTDDHPATATDAAATAGLSTLDTRPSTDARASSSSSKNPSPKTLSPNLTISTITANAAATTSNNNTASHNNQKNAPPMSAALATGVSTESTNTPVTPTPPASTAAEAVATAARQALRTVSIEGTKGPGRWEGKG